MYYFIVNPHSKSGKAAAIWKRIDDMLINSGIKYKVYFTRFPGHAVRITRQICKLQTGRKNIIIVGGDGTVNEVINGLPSFNDITIGYIPTGSGNDLARGLFINREPSKALASVLHPNGYVYTDIGLLTISAENEKIQRKFAVSSGIGYDAEICRQNLVSRLKKVLNRLGLGKISYLLIGLSQIFNHKPADGNLIIDKLYKIKLKNILFVSFMIQKSEGGGLRMAPEARYDDGLLSICIVSGISKFRALCTIPALFLGRHAGKKGIRIINCKEAEIITDIPFAVHTDGEINGERKHVKVSCSADKLRFIR